MLLLSRTEWMMKILHAPGILYPRQSPPASTPRGHDSSHANSYYIVAGICSTLMTIFVIMRLYIRFRITCNPWWDDVALVIGLFSQAAYTGVVWRSGTVGLGTHMSDVSAEDLAKFFDLAIPSAILTAPAIFFTKLALLLLYLRLFSQNRPVKFGIWAGVVACSIFYTCAMFLYIFTKSDAQVKVTYGVASFGVVTDVYIICLPLFAIARLHLKRAKKWRVAAMFLTGLLAVVMSFLGCVYRFQLDVADLTYSLLAIYIVNTVEVDIGIICCCLPLMAALFKTTQKESWWLTSFRSLRDTLNNLWSRSGSGSGSRGSGGTNDTGTSRFNGSNRAGYRAFFGGTPAESIGDDIELVGSSGAAEGMGEKMAGQGESRSSFRKPPAAVVAAAGREGIWRETHIEQEWTTNRRAEV
ncbi:hypothetical protein BJY04DRAFT_222928 [Aspergillus karnatakaensis]|uniref:uncharacterized protein n=1 Tax=Aspergillus karnatakaensis TaxID=1810916 RepID=UPI003CCDA345